MATENQIRSYIDAQKAKVHVDSYHDAVMSKGYVERVSGIVAGALLGLVTGLVLGAGIGLIPPLVGAEALTWGFVFKTMAMCGAAGLTTGSAAGAIYGASSGSAAVAAEEMERRMKEYDVEKKLLKDPNLQEKAEAFSKNGAAEKAAVAKTHTVKDVKAQSNGKLDFASKIFDWRVGAFFGALGALAGLVLGAGLMPAEIITGLPFLAETSTTLASKMIAGAGVVGLVGVTVGVNYSVLFTSAVNWVKKKALGEAAVAEPPKPPLQLEPQPAEQVTKAPEILTERDGQQAARSFTLLIANETAVQEPNLIVR